MHVETTWTISQCTIAAGKPKCKHGWTIRNWMLELNKNRIEMGKIVRKWKVK